jgi:hypothetical protein
MAVLLLEALQSIVPETAAKPDEFELFFVSYYSFDDFPRTKETISLNHTVDPPPRLRLLLCQDQPQLRTGTEECPAIIHLCMFVSSLGWR